MATTGASWLANRPALTKNVYAFEPMLDFTTSASPVVDPVDWNPFTEAKTTFDVLTVQKAVKIEDPDTEKLEPPVNVYTKGSYL